MLGSQEEKEELDPEPEEKKRGRPRLEIKGQRRQTPRSR